MINIFVIHYRPLVDRYNCISDCLRMVQLVSTVTFVTIERLPYLVFSDPFAINPSQYAPGYHPRLLKFSEISVFMKHYHSIQLISSLSNAESFAVILEDDAIFDPTTFNSFLKSLLISANLYKYDLLFFGSGIHDPAPISTRTKEIIEPFHTYHKSKCADSYAIKPSAARQILLSYRNILPFMPYDWDLNYRINFLNLRVGWLNPSITVQGSQTGRYPSSIQI